MNPGCAQMASLQALDCAVDPGQNVPMARKIVYRHQAREPSPALNELYDVIGDSFGLSRVLHELESGPPDRSDRTPPACQRVVPSDGSTLCCARKSSPRPRVTVRDHGARSNQNMFLCSSCHGRYSKQKPYRRINRLLPPVLREHPMKVAFCPRLLPFSFVLIPIVLRLMAYASRGTMSSGSA